MRLLQGFGPEHQGIPGHTFSIRFARGSSVKDEYKTCADYCAHQGAVSFHARHLRASSSRLITKQLRTSSAGRGSFLSCSVIGLSEPGD